MNKFDTLKDIPELKEYDPRHDPTVIPIASSEQELLAVAELPAPEKRKSKKAYYTCGDYHMMYMSGKVTPLEVVGYLMPLVQRDSEPPGKYSVSFLQVREDLILEAARASTKRYQTGNPLSVLDGVPLTVKDEVDLSGYRKCYGSKLDFTDPDNRTAWCLMKWQEAGALIIGKTNMHEMGLDTTNNNITFGTPLNPHNQGYYTGGSSGGSACAVAQGICPVALGVDGGGSIRLPASFCGIYGLKPTHGRVSDRAGHENWNSVAVTGPMASSMDDLELGYRMMAVPDPESRTSSSFPSTLVRAPAASSSRRCLGICKSWIDRADPGVREMFDQAVSYLTKQQGYEVVDIQIPFLPEGQKAHALSILSESRARVSKEQMSKLTYHNQLLLNVAGSHATAQDFLFAQRLRSLLMSHLRWLWEHYPGMLVLTPTTACAGWKIAQPSDLSSPGFSDGDMSLRAMEYVWFANFVGAPSISVPMGYAEGDVPVGLMVFFFLFALPQLANRP